MNKNQQAYVFNKITEVENTIVESGVETVQNYFNILTISFVATASYHLNEYMIVNVLLTIRKSVVGANDSHIKITGSSSDRLQPIIEKIDSVVDDMIAKFNISETDPNEHLIYDYVTEKMHIKRRKEIRLSK